MLQLNFRHLALPLVFFLATTVYLATALQITPLYDEGIAGPAFIPVTISLLMYLCLFFVVKDMVQQGVETDDDVEFSIKTLAALSVTTVGYLIAFKPLGYSVSTFFFVLALLYIFKLDAFNLLKKAMTATAITAAFYVLFAVCFQVRLPSLALGGSV
ncbi:MAG: tripartite tricarboxylate transporter TctB family protein [Pontibacterium sp.]